MFEPRATSRRSLVSQFDSSMIRIFRPCSSREPRNGLSFHAQLCSSKCFLHRRIVELEARREAAVLVEAVPRALQVLRAFDGPLQDEVRGLGEVSAGPGEADGKRSRSELPRPTCAPASAARIRHRDAGLRPAEVLFEKAKGRRRMKSIAARSVAQIECRDVARIPPQDVTRRRSGGEGPRD